MNRCLCRCSSEEVRVGLRDESRTPSVFMGCTYEEVEMYLTNMEARPYLTSEDRMEPLLFAAAKGLPDLVRLLLARNTNVNVQDLLLRSALHLAVSCGHLEIVQRLLKHGAKVDIEDFYGFTPLCEAVWRQSTEIVEILIKAGAKPSDEDCLLHYSVLRRHFNITKLLLSSGTNPNVRDSNGDTPLIIAAKTHNIDIARILLEHGAIPHATNPLTTLTPLHLAGSSNWDKDDYITSFEEFVNLLIKYGVDLNRGGLVLGSAFTDCLYVGKYKTAEYLIQMGVDVNKVPQGTLIQFCNLRLAFRRKRFSLVKLMVAAGHNLKNKDLKEMQYPEYEKDIERDLTMDWLLRTKRNPQSLKDICRLQIRKHFGSTISTVVRNLNIPKMLKSFLMLEGIANEVNIGHVPLYSRYQLLY